VSGLPLCHAKHYYTFSKAPQDRINSDMKAQAGSIDNGNRKVAPAIVNLPMNSAA